ESGGADDLVGPVQLGRDAEATGSPRALDRIVPGAPGRVGRRRPAAEQGAALVRPRVVVRGQPATREELAWEVERASLGFAPAHRDDVRAGGERVQPLGCGGHARADDLHTFGVLVRLVGVDRTW